MKKLTLIILISIAIFQPQIVYADMQQDLTEQVEDGLENLDFSKVEAISDGYIGDIVQRITQIINGEFDSAQDFLQFIFTVFHEDLLDICPQLISIFVVLVLIGLMQKTAGGFISPGTDRVVSFVGRAVIILALIFLFQDVFQQVDKVISELSLLAEGAMPILLTLVVANGSTKLSSVCQPSMVMFSTVIIGVIKNVLLPLTLSATAFSFVSNLSQNVKVSKISSFLNNLASWILGILFTVFSAFTSVQGIVASSMDGVSYRMAKFTAKNYIPILGGYVSEGFDIVVASTSLIKNSFGVVLLSVVALMIIKPLLTIIALNVGLQGIAALSEPIVEGSNLKIFDSLTKSLTFLSALIVAVAFMFCILVIVAIGCANGVV